MALAHSSFDARDEPYWESIVGVQAPWGSADTLLDLYFAQIWMDIWFEEGEVEGM